MTVILSILSRFLKKSLEDSFVNLQLNGYKKSHRTVRMLLHYLVKAGSRTHDLRSRKSNAL